MLKKTLYATLMMLAMAAFVGGAAQAKGMSHGKEITKVKLSTLPNVKAKEGAEADFKLSEDGTTLHYVLRAKNVSDVTMGHIHEVGGGGAPGGIIAWLYPTTGEAPMLKEGKTTGVVAEGDINAARLEGPMKGGTVKELYEKIEEGKAGIAIHTKENPGGELWGFAKAKQHAMNKVRPKKATY